MKISAIVSWLFAVAFQSKVPSKDPPYYPRSFGILGNQPASKKIAEARLFELKELMTVAESAIIKEMQEWPSDAESSHARIKGRQKALVEHLRESAYIKSWLDDYLEAHCVPYRFQSKADTLLVFSRELTRDRISYVRLHTEKHPPDTLKIAEERIAFLDEQEYVLDEVIGDIGIKGKELGCKDCQIHRVQRHVHDIKRVILHERRILKDWATRERMAIRIRQDTHSTLPEASLGGGSAPFPA